MKNYTIGIIVIIFGIITFSACNSSFEGSKFATTIKPGIYRIEAFHIKVGRKQISTYIGEGPTYLYRTFHFSKEGSLSIQVHSDIPDEIGVANAQYTVSGKKLIVSIKKSTTSLYPAGSQIIFTSFKTVSSRYSKTFHDNSGTSVFHGPGLILHKKYPDKQDINNNEDTTETVHKTFFYKYKK